MKENITKEEALKKIEELKQFVEQEDAKTETKTLGVAIRSRFASGEIIYQSSKSTIREAVIEALASGSKLRGSDLRGSNLSDCDLRGSNLSDCDLSDCDLRGSDLSGSNLSDCNLSDCNLSGSNLRGSELQNARFYGRGGTSVLKRSQLPDFLAALGFVIED